MKLHLIACLIISPLILSAQSTRFRHWNPIPPHAPPTLPVQTVNTTTPGPDIFISSPEGVEFYATNASGTVTATGGPFPVSGMVAGATQSFLVSFDSQNLYSYPINQSSVGPQAFSVNAVGYPGGECGNPVDMVMKPNGILYLDMAGATDATGYAICDAVQTWDVASGDFNFLGSSSYDIGPDAFPATIPAIFPNFAFDTTPLAGACEQEFDTFSVDSTQTLNLISNPLETFPTPDPTGGDFFPMVAASDGGSHLAVLMFQDYAPPCGPIGVPQLASFTVGNDGSIVSTNTWQNMPYIGQALASGLSDDPYGQQVLSFDPTGAFVAIAGEGLEVYAFNGSKPMTIIGSTQVPSAGIGKVSWDSAGHLYAWGIDSDGIFKVFTFAVNGQSVSEIGTQVVAQDSTGMVTTE